MRNTWPIVSPDGDRLAYLSRRSGAGRHIWVASLDGAGARQLTFETPVGPMHSWLPGGEEIAYLAARDRRLELKAIELTTGRSRLLRGYGPWSMTERIKLMHARFTPDGDEIVISQVRDGVMNLWTQDLQTGALRQLTHDREAAGFPTVSEDGRWVAYEVMRGGDVHLAIVPSGGGEGACADFGTRPLLASQLRARRRSHRRGVSHRRPLAPRRDLAHDGSTRAALRARSRQQLRPLSRLVRDATTASSTSTRR